MMNKKTQHILSTSSQLLGICFIVLTALRIQKLFEASVIDELTAVAAVLFMTSSLLSFLSIRSETKNEDKFEKWADIIFLFALAIMLLVILLITFDLIS
ncbi:MAG: hypothetical protein K1X85_09895 [Ignavibacteria bacterium]|nr:hypothetical protein [Ignavibacteria bacterium]